MAFGGIGSINISLEVLLQRFDRVIRPLWLHQLCLQREQQWYNAATIMIQASRIIDFVGHLDFLSYYDSVGPDCTVSAGAWVTLADNS